MTVRSFVYEGIRRISVANLGDGSIVVEPGPSEQAVEGTVGCSDEGLLSAVSIRQDHDHLRVEVPRWGFLAGAVHLRLGVPPGLDYDLSSGSADIRVGVEAGRTRTVSGSGEISLNVVHDLACSTGSGSVSVGETRGEAAKINSGSGDVVIYRARCPVSLKSGSGDLTVKNLDGARVQASSGSGNIAVPSTTGSVDLRTASGAITVGVADGLLAWLDLHSVSGEIRIALDASAEPAPGEPYVTVKARSASGEVAVYRA